MKVNRYKTIYLFRKAGLRKINRFHVVGGEPIVQIGKGSRFSFGNELVMVNDQKNSTLGRTGKCKFLVFDNASLTLGEHVSMSNTCIVATRSIRIGNRVMIGGGVTIVDSDFHSMNSMHWFTPTDELEAASLPVIIGSNVFIGMDVVILKGVSIGDNVRIAARSVVTKSIPDNQIWGGNPASFIKNLPYKFSN
jgi:acetyltransferase-like isoleucine patch superfamily enzyme